MVVAGPGTGKTQVLTLRVANILQKTQVNPGNILALTFTENGAAEMRRRLAEVIGAAAYQVNISTFHSFANQLIEEYSEEFGDILGRRAASEVEQIETLQEVISNSKLKLLRPFGEPFFYLSSARQALAHLKKEGVAPADFADLLKKQQTEFDKIDDLYYDSGRYKGKMKGKYADFKKQLNKNTELAVIYKNYQISLAGKKLYDFDDMILELLKALQSNPDFLLRSQEKYQYFLVDEHQDTNNAQNKILELLSNFFDNPNLFVVGDERQAIFRFQGASLANFLYFQKLYPQAKLITLQKNYRSTQPILDAAQSFIQNNQQKISTVLTGIKDDLVAQISDQRPSGNSFVRFSSNKTLFPEASRDHKVQVYEFKKHEAEYYFIASKIKQLISEGVPPAEIAVIYRDNRDAGPVAEMLAKQGVSFRVESQKNVLEDPQIKNLILLLRFLSDATSEERLFEVLHADFLGIPALEVYKLFSQSARQRGVILASFAETKSMFPGVKDHFANFLRWKKLSKNTTLAEFFETVVRESGFLTHLLSQPDSAIRLNRLEALFSEIKNLVQNHKNFGLADLVHYFDTLAKHGVSIKEKNLAGQSGVRLMTAHGAKGLEFDHVFITNLFDGHWGNRRIPQLIKLPDITKPASQGRRGVEGKSAIHLPENSRAKSRGSKVGRIADLPLEASRDFDVSNDLKNDDERRLFYVAVTRARKMAYLSYALAGYDKRELLPSQFLGEIKAELKELCPAEEFEKKLAMDQSFLYQPRAAQKFSVLDKEYLNAVFFKRGLSATAINNYLRCPWKYFYSSLLKIPKAKTKHQMYGTAVHAGLKSFFDRLKMENSADKSFLVDSFEEALKNEPLTKNDFTESLEKGQTALKAYFDRYQNSWRTQTINEFRVQNVMFKLPEGEVKLTGSLDKIEPMEEDAREINVVDYKTGKPRTRHELEGQTQSATGDYKRQLVFYKLLLDSHPTAKFKMVSGEIDFVEPDQKGNFHKEKFLISNDEVQNLRKIITEVSDQILNLKFQDQTCGDRDCEFCELRNKITHV